MYLNVNLTPAAAAGGSAAEGSSCVNTPRTPEILNSLISLSTTPISSYSHFPTSQGSTSDLLSPTSSSASPSEERSFQQLGTPTSSCGGSQMSPGRSSDPGGGGSGMGTYVFARLSGVYKGMPTTPGTPSPPISELASPVNTVEATKSALIKEGLKIQIKSKLLSAGVEPSEILSEKKPVKEEVSDSQELTPQDEERRMRRRERNKIAATKCRNKKKEKTVNLLTESESVEDQNHRLKSEIQRLTNEKLKLKKLLEDPSHVASCRHSCSRGTHNPLVVTSPDAPEQLPSSSSAEGILASSICTEAAGSEVVSSIPPYCSPSAITSWDSSFSSSDSPSPSYINLSPSTISPLSLPSVSPPHLVSSSYSVPPQTSPHTYFSPAGSCSPYTTDGGSFVNFSPPTDNSGNPPTSLTLPVSEPSLDPRLESLASSTCNAYLNVKAPKLQTNKCQQPYPTQRTSRIPSYQNDGSVVSYCSQEGFGCRDFGFNFPSDSDISSHDPFLHPNSSNEYLPSTSPPYKVGYISTGKQKNSTNTRNRYIPYDISNRHSNHQQQQQQQQLLQMQSLSQQHQEQQHQLPQSSQPQQLQQAKSSPVNFASLESAESASDFNKQESVPNVSNKEEHYSNVSYSAFKSDVASINFYSTCM